MSELYLTLRSRLEEVTNWVILGREVMRDARKNKGLSFEAVGRLLNVSAKTYERWEGRGRVPRGDLERVAETIGLEIDHPAFEPVKVSVPTQPGEEWQARLERIEAQLDEIRRLLAEPGSSA